MQGESTIVKLIPVVEGKKSFAKVRIRFCSLWPSPTWSWRFSLFSSHHLFVLQGDFSTYGEENTMNSMEVDPPDSPSQGIWKSCDLFVVLSYLFHHIFSIISQEGSPKNEGLWNMKQGRLSLKMTPSFRFSHTLFKDIHWFLASLIRGIFLKTI